MVVVVKVVVAMMMTMTMVVVVLVVLVIVLMIIDINDDASQFTTYTDFVTNSYGEFGDSSREKSLVPVKKNES